MFHAHLRSHSGHNAGAALAHAPTSPEYVIAPHLFRVASGKAPTFSPSMSLVAGLPVGTSQSRRLRKRASTERMLARVCREAGARVRFNAFLRDMNVNVAATDERRIEVLAQDLPCFEGAQLAVDTTLRCVLSSAGEPHPNTADVDGAALVVAREDKERTYPELTTSRRCRLVVVAVETGGWWSSEAVDFARQLAFVKAREVPSFMQFSTLAWERRWTRMLSTVCSL